jgi:hypothetical protein
MLAQQSTSQACRGTYPGDAFLTITIELLLLCAVHVIAPKIICVFRYDVHDPMCRWVTSYTLEHSRNGQNWEVLLCQVKSPGDSSSVFIGNSDSASFVIQRIVEPVCTRFLRFSPLTWQGAPVIRMRLLGRSPGVPLGMQNESITDDQITASSQSASGPSKCARLHCAGGGWMPAPSDIGCSLTIKLKAQSLIGGFALQVLEQSHSSRNSPCVLIFRNNDIRRVVTPVGLHLALPS